MSNLKQVLNKNLSHQEIDYSSSFDELKIYRRNHLFLASQKNFFKGSSVTIYNGYDFFVKSINSNMLLAGGTTNNINVAGLVFTREINVVHKTKLSKAARKLQTKRPNTAAKAKRGVSSQQARLMPKRTLLTKTLRK